MKKTKKLFLSLALIIGFATLAPSLASFKNLASAEPIAVNHYIQVENFDKNAIVGGTYEVPSAKVLEVGSNTELDIESIFVFNPYGESVDIEDNKVEIKHFGNYSVQYKYLDTIEKLTFRAVEGKYSFEFKENSEHIIPSNMPSGLADKPVVLETPTVLNEDGEEADIEGTYVNIIVKDSEDQVVSLTTQASGLKSFVPDKIGLWRIRYNFVSAQGRILATDEKTINVDNNFNTVYDLEISHGTPPTSADTKVEVSLPAVTVTNKITKNTINGYRLEIKAEKIVIVNGNDDSFVDVTAQTVDGRKFTPQEDGDYRITYKVTDFFGNKWEKTLTYIRDVRDRKAPTVKVVSAYDSENLENFLDAEHKMPSKAKSDHLVLPAIWAEDNVSQTLEDLTLTRRIRRVGGTFVFETTENPNKEIVFNPKAELDQDTQIEQEFDEEALDNNGNLRDGTYRVIYTAKDKAGNESGSVEFTIEINKDFQEGVAPEVKWAGNIKSQIRLGETLAFNAPVATHEAHTRLKTVVEYAYADTFDEISHEDVTGWEVLEPKDVYEITLPETVEAGVKTLRLRAKTYSYDAESVFEYETVRIFETQDNTPVTLEEVDVVSVNPLNTYKEGNDITLGKFVFKDDLIDFVAIEIFAVAKNGQKIPVLNRKTTTDKALGTVTIENAKFFASYSGEYTITVRATDINNNSATYSYIIDIAAYETQIEPHFSSPKTIHDGIVQLGTTIEIPEAKIISTAALLDPEHREPYNVNVIEGPANFRINTYEFEAFEEGVYTIQYSAEVEGEEITATFTVEVKDTKAPEIAGWSEVKYNIEKNSSVSIPEGGISFKIPLVAVTDNSDVDMKNSKVEVKKSNVMIRDISLEKLVPTNELINVPLNDNALYTITYTIKDLALVPNTKTFVATITVGDNTPPKVELKDTTKKLTSETAKLNSTLTLNLDRIKFYDPDNGDLAVEDLEITLRVNGENVKNKHEIDGEETTLFGYVLNKAGTYTLSIRAKDAVGNTSEYYTETFTVSEKSNDGVETTEVIGVVLIVISALILAGSIIYFIISKRKVKEFK